MAHKLLNLASRVFNKPQFMLLEDFNNIVEYLVDRNNENVVIDPKPKEEMRYDGDRDSENYKLYRLGINPETMQGTLDVSGTLVYRAGQSEGLCSGELISYEKLENQFRAQVNAGITSAVLTIDSGGGEAYGCFEAANNIKQLAKEKGIKLYSYVDGTAASAAYAWASIADEVVANPQARVGSIGVVVQLINNSKMLEKAGISRSFIYAGENKIPFDSEGEFTDEFKTKIQKSVNKSYKSFVDFIATNRTLQASDIVNTQADVFDADEALSLGLIDKIMTREEFGNHLSTSNKQNNPTYFKEVTMSDSANVTQELYNELQTKYETQGTQLTEALESVKTLGQQLATATEATKTLQSTIDNLTKEAVTKERKQKLEAVLGTENPEVETLLSTFSVLGDEQFNTVLSSYNKNIDLKAQEMKEVGKNTDTDTAKQNASELAKERAKARWNKED